MSDILAERLAREDGGRILDLATGNGSFLARLAGTFASYEEALGLDLEERIVEAARTFAAEQEIERASFRVMDGAELTFPDESFDTVAMANSLHHLERLDETLSEMRRVLRPGGLFIVAEMFRDGQNARQQMHVDYHHWWAEIDRRRGVVHNPTFTRAELEELLGGRGFAEQEILLQNWPQEEDQSEEALRPLIEMNDKVLARIEGHADYAELKARGEELKRRLLDTGWALATQLIFIGRK